MRYKEGEIPAELLAANSSNDMLLFTSVIGFLIGVVFFIVGKKGRQLWIWTWGLGLAVFSIYLWTNIKYGFHLFTHF